MSAPHFDPATYHQWVRRDVPLYDELQQRVARATVPPAATAILDLGSGTGETLAQVLPLHPGARAVGIDESDAMLGVARDRLGAHDVTFVVADLSDPLPPGPFDLVTSVLAVHHLDGPGKAALFEAVAGVLRPGGRFVLGDVVVPRRHGAVVTPITDDYDKPSTVDEQVGWLERAGLAVAVRWQRDDLAVLVADRPVAP
ncbi:MAG: class I SAM-dependent methyltransferase [Acidimicrobiales bacterium]